MTDARVLAFPARSSVAPFVWVTCPSVLARLKRDVSLCRIEMEVPDIKPNGPDHFICIIGEIKEKSIVLEDLAVVSGNSTRYLR